MAARDNLSPRQFMGLNSLAADLNSKGLSSADITAEHVGKYPLDAVQRSMAVIEEQKAKYADDPFAGL